MKVDLDDRQTDANQNKYERKTARHSEWSYLFTEIFSHTHRAQEHTRFAIQLLPQTAISFLVFTLVSIAL